MEQPRAVFEFTLLDQRNRPYLIGQSSRIASNAGWDMVGAGIALATVIGFIFVLSALSLLGAVVSGNNTNLGNRVLVTLLTGVGTAFLTFQVIAPLRTVSANRRLAREGQVVRGEIAGVEMRQVWRGYFLSITYSFTTPEGKTLTGETGFPASPYGLYPTRGAPLAILYVNENLHRAL